MVERSGRLYPANFWPNLSVLSVWTGGTMGMYLPQVKEYYGNPAFRDHGLSASEGHMTTPLQDETTAGLLDSATHYFEFIRRRRTHDNSRRPSRRIELEVGKDYYTLLTTPAANTVTIFTTWCVCVGFEGTCPLLETLNKGAHFSSMTGEKLSEHQVVPHRAIRAGRCRPAAAALYAGSRARRPGSLHAVDRSRKSTTTQSAVGRAHERQTWRNELRIRRPVS